MRYHPFKPSVSTLEDCDHHNASKEFVQRSIREHNDAVFAHNKQFDRVYDTIENVKKMKTNPSSLEMTGLDKIKYTLNANLTATVNGQKKRILTSDDDRLYGERYYQQSAEIKELKDKLIESNYYTFDANNFNVSPENVVTIKTGEISENSNQLVTGGDVYTAMSDIRSDLTEVDTSINSELSDINAQISNVNTSISNINQEISDVNESISNVSANLSETNAAIRLELSDVASDIENTNTEISNVNSSLTAFKNFYKQNGFYHFTECEIMDTVDGITNIGLTPFAVSLIPRHLQNIRLNIKPTPTEIDDNVVRDLIMVIPSTNSVTNIEWPTNIYPKNDAVIDYKCEAGVDNVYWISEFSPNKFVVSGWQAKE